VLVRWLHSVEALYTLGTVCYFGGRDRPFNEKASTSGLRSGALA
jgi:uncharacterized membrane protein